MCGLTHIQLFVYRIYTVVWNTYIVNTELINYAMVCDDGQREYTPLNTRMPYNIVLDRLAVKATTDDDATT